MQLLCKPRQKYEVLTNPSLKLYSDPIRVIFLLKNYLVPSVKLGRTTAKDKSEI